MLELLLERLKQKDVEAIKGFQMSRHSSVRIGGVASAAVLPKSKEELIYTLNQLLGMGLKFTIVGGMTNILPIDGEYDGVLVLTKKLNRKSRAENTITAECGVLTTRLTGFAREYSLGGFEGLSMIPGTVGGALSGNAGAYGSTVGELFSSGEFFSLKSGETTTLCRDELGFSYRHSVIPEEQLVFLRGEFSFIPSEERTISEKMKEFREMRLASQPSGKPSLGSVFKAKDGVGAGYYVDRAGLKGFSVGGAAVSEKHAGFIINTGGATAEDFSKLVRIIKTRVYDLFGILLEEEIKYLR